MRPLYGQAVFPEESRSHSRSLITWQNNEVRDERRIPWNSLPHLRSIFRKSGELVLVQTLISLEWWRVQKWNNGITKCDRHPLSFLRRLIGWEKIDVAIWGGCSVKWKMYMLYDQVISVGRLRKKLMIHVARATRTRIFITAQFVIGKNGLKPNMIFTRQWVNICGLFIPWGTVRLLKWINRNSLSMWTHFKP